MKLHDEQAGRPEWSQAGRRSQAEARAYGTIVERRRVSSSLHPGKARIPQSLDDKDDLLHDGEKELRIPVYKARLHRGYRKSIPYFEEKDNPVKHIVALCSILWQRN